MPVLEIAAVFEDETDESVSCIECGTTTNPDGFPLDDEYSWFDGGAHGEQSGNYCDDCVPTCGFPCQECSS